MLEKNKKSKTYKGEAKDLTSSEGHDKTFMYAACTFFCSSNICVYSNFHSNVSRENRSETSNEESNSSVWCVGDGFSSEEDECSKCYQEEGEEKILLFEEGNSAL